VPIHGPNPVNPNNLRSRVLAPSVKSIGLPVDFNAFRHTSASLRKAQQRPERIDKLEVAGSRPVAPDS
jgi:hypothetical protein